MERKNTFNEIARRLSKKYRPSYPEQLFTDILELSGYQAGRFHT